MFLFPLVGVGFYWYGRRKEISEANGRACLELWLVLICHRRIVTCNVAGLFWTRNYCFPLMLLSDQYEWLKKYFLMLAFVPNKSFTSQEAVKVSLSCVCFLSFFRGVISSGVCGQLTSLNFGLKMFGLPIKVSIILEI